MNRLSEAWKALTKRSVNQSSGTNLFGSIAKGSFPFSANVDFIPIDNTGNVMNVGEGIGPVWVGLESLQMQEWAYHYCSPLASVIDRLAEADTNGRVEILDEDGNTVKNINRVPNYKRVINLLKNPNPLQTWDEFNSQQVVLCKKFGYCIVFAVGPSGMDKTYTRSLWNIRPSICTPEINENFSFYSEDEVNPIKYWNFTVLNKTYKIPSSDILLIKDGFVDNRLNSNFLPISKVAGLDYFVSNICAALEADNVLLKKKGPLGVFSYDQKPDMAGLIPMLPEDKEDLQDDLKKYGLSWTQLQYVISKQPVRWNPMSFNVRDLMTKETVRQAIDGICDRFGYPAELMSGKNATYENRNSAEKFLYQNNIIPFALRRMARYDKFFGISGLTLDYDHLPVLQEDIMHAGQAAEALSTALTMDWQNGIITYNEYRIAKNLDSIPGMDIYYNDYLKKFPPVEIQTKKPIKDEPSPKD